MSSATPTSAPGKIVARAASVHIDNVCNAFLHDCFRQFGIHVVAVPGDVVEVLNRQKFEACVLRLYDPEAERILNAARNSTSNRRMVIYGIARSAHEALLHSNFGVNAIFDEPLDRQSVLKVVRSTHLLVLHELRRYVRVPVISEMVIDARRRQHRRRNHGHQLRRPGRTLPGEPTLHRSRESYLEPARLAQACAARFCLLETRER